MDSSTSTKPEKIQKNMRTSVRSIVEFIFREGDIDNRFGKVSGTEAMLEGTRIHKKIQSSQGGNYQAEVPLQLILEEEEYTLTIDGRADGIFTEEFDEFLPETENAIVSASKNNPEQKMQIAGGRIGSRKKKSPGQKKKKEDLISKELTIFDFLDPSPTEQLPTTQPSTNLPADQPPKDQLHRNRTEKNQSQDVQFQSGKTASIILPPSLVWIDEIKGIYHKLEHMEKPVYVHLAQAKCYAYMYAVLHREPFMGVQMTYCNMDTEDIRRFRYTYTFAELEEWFHALWMEYRKWADFACEWEKIRQASIKQLEFPFTYRDGQKALAQDVYRTILRKKNLFIQAPTGVGKTITTLYPAIKAMGEGLADRIFYLTAKTVTATVARDTFSLLEENGYRAKTVQLTAKEKICLCGESRVDQSDSKIYEKAHGLEGDLENDGTADAPETGSGIRGECNPANCPYARGHFDRINDALYDLLTTSGNFTREIIRNQAKKYRVCPFEMSLDLSSFSDNIICDYNYVFDPQVSLKRFFGEGMKGNYLFLIDEAHNLVDRSREMYSAALYKEDFLIVKKLTENKKIRRELDKCNKILLEYKRDCTDLAHYQLHEDIGPFLMPLQRLASDLDELLQKPDNIPNRKEILEFYFNIRNFLYIYDLLSGKYVIYSELQEDGRFMLKLFCVDPSENLQSYLNKGRSAVFFSATLLPVNYYKSLLSTKEDNYAVYAHSSFLPEKQLILIGNDISTKYTRRTETEFRKYAEYIRKITGARKGNYMVFFPSYKLMEQVYAAFCSLVGKNNSSATQILPEGIRCIVQSQYMKEAQREAFLAEFEHEDDHTLIAFCIMGGIFGEGIDLKNERLIGTIIAGTGLPQVCNEKEILKKYYDDQGKNGFDYAYRFPGMNKVLQAAGRVIRTEEDTGVIALLDQRFLQDDYLSLFPREWENLKITELQNAGERADSFWKAVMEKADIPIQKQVEINGR